MLAAAKYIGAGLACSGLIGAGAGIGIIFSSLIASTARNPQIRAQLFSYAILGFRFGRRSNRIKVFCLIPTRTQQLKITYSLLALI